MYLFLHIKITKDPFIFKNDAFGNIKRWLPHVSLFDIDNYSDAVTTQTAIKAMEMAEKIFIQIDAEAGPELGGVLKVLNHIMKKPSSAVVIDYQGGHGTLDKIMARFSDKRADQRQSLQQKVKSFFND